MSTFAEKELAILRNAVDKIQDDQKREEIKSGDIVPIIQIVEDFIKQKKLICYGGSAINNILPDDDQFYDCLLYTSPSPRDLSTSRMPSSA